MSPPCTRFSHTGSSYYKLLIGQLLGYKLENVLAYVAASGEPASEELQKQVGGRVAGAGRLCLFK